MTKLTQAKKQPFTPVKKGNPKVLTKVLINVPTMTPNTASTFEPGIRQTALRDSLSEEPHT